MTAADWGALIPAVVTVLVSVAAYLKAETARVASADAKQRVDAHLAALSEPAKPPSPPSTGV